MPFAEAAVTTRSHAASRIRLGPSACQNFTSKSRPGARPRTRPSITTRSAMALLWQVILGRAKTKHFHWQRQAVATLLEPDLHVFGEVRLCGVTVYRRIAEDKKNPMRHTIAFIVAALLAVAPVAYGKKNIRSFSHRSSRGTKPRIRMLHSGSSKGRPHPASPHGNRVHKRL